MRLIDADAMIDRLKKWDTKDNTDKALYNFTLSRINEQPTIHPSAQPERKKGKWIIDRGLYKCSSCNQLWAEWWALSKPIERMRKEMPYCPMCGSYNGEGEIENDTRMLRFMQETDVQLH